MGNQINKPTEYFETTTYTGTGSSLSISSLNFSPDWVWIKRRDAIDNHALFDSVRGATKILQSNVSNAEATVAQSVTSFDSNGFTVGTDGQVNTNTEGHVAWSWRGSDSSAVSNTDGSITSSVSASTTSGFSIVSYTGTGANATVGHGLGVAPKVVLIKGRSTTLDWVYGGDNIGWTKYLVLNKTDTSGTASTVWNDTAPTSSVFSLGSNAAVNQSGATQIAYCFSEVKGFSKFGSYTGNGSTDGTFIYTGMRPAFVIIKRTNSAGNNWQLYDNKRNAFNVINNVLFPNLSDAEATQSTTNIDMLSQGFKLRGNSATVNGSGDSYIYMCFSEFPLVGTNNIPSTAR